ncbi:hypothetical protein [Candidatus Endoriftia persephonae]|jgi:hypothetical protein|nr:hypothetical protein [Candidatus Endoriftia persephone]USF86327.1 hypothetical protein L0Y14_09220 [Candidatus Endoriftia persephone]
MKQMVLSTMLLALGISGCASMAPPSSAEMAKLPVVEIGSGTPDSPDYVLHIPAGQTFPVELVIDGSMLQQKAGANTQVSLQRELYLYKQWLSYDGKSWQPTHEQVDFTLSAGLNGEGGKVVVKANDR